MAGVAHISPKRDSVIGVGVDMRIRLEALDGWAPTGRIHRGDPDCPIGRSGSGGNDSAGAARAHLAHGGRRVGAPDVFFLVGEVGRPDLRRGGAASVWCEERRVCALYGFDRLVCSDRLCRLYGWAGLRAAMSAGAVSGLPGRERGRDSTDRSDALVDPF